MNRAVKRVTIASIANPLYTNNEHHSMSSLVTTHNANIVHQAIIQYRTNPEAPRLGRNEQSEGEDECGSLPSCEWCTKSKTQKGVKCLVRNVRSSSCGIQENTHRQYKIRNECIRKAENDEMRKFESCKQARRRRYVGIINHLQYQVSRRENQQTCEPELTDVTNCKRSE